MSSEERIFDLLEDLDAEADAILGAERALEVADQARAEYATVTLNARLMAAAGAELSLGVRGAGALRGQLAAVAASWLLLRTGERVWVVLTSAVLWCDGAPAHAVAEAAWPRTARLGVGSVLRRMADDDAAAQVVLADGTRVEGHWRRIGSDFAELATGHRRGPLLVPFAAISAVAQVASES
ncbi:hypothetical protein NODU109028_19100 [Nocardioides dubius]|uniref:hypothetical protein n=1 Tax=Nocardioides dubius TaxID=317019 RepID=UPI0039E8AE56